MRLNDAHCHFFSPQLLRDAGARDPHGTDSASRRKEATLETAGMGVRLARLRSSPAVGRGARSPSGVARRADRERAGRRGVGRGRGRASSRSVRRLLHGRPDAAATRRRESRAAIGASACARSASFRRCTYSLHDARARRSSRVAAAEPGTAVFVHCGVLSVGVRKKLGCRALRHPLRQPARPARASRSSYPQVPIIVPHFGAGLLREALMLADLCPNVYLDTSSSNAGSGTSPG